MSFFVVVLDSRHPAIDVKGSLGKLLSRQRTSVLDHWDDSQEDLYMEHVFQTVTTDHRKNQTQTPGLVTFVGWLSDPFKR